jgi:hypothetical protein
MASRSTGTTNNDKELFVSVLCRLLRPVSDEVISEVLEAESELVEDEGLPEKLPLQDFIQVVHAKILGRLYDLAQNDGMLSMALIPLMAHIRKMPNPVPSEPDLRVPQKKGKYDLS